jgi:hypothetical protein
LKAGVFLRLQTLSSPRAAFAMTLGSKMSTSHAMASLETSPTSASI